jgi:hypothetical protein
MASIHESDLGVKEFSDVSESEIEDDLTDVGFLLTPRS